MSPLHVAHIIYSLYTGGAEEVIAAYAYAHNKSSFKLSVVSLTGGGHLVNTIRSYGVPVYLLGKSKRFDPSVLGKITSLFRAIKPDIVHAHNPAGSHWGLVPSKIARCKAFVRTEHNVYYPGRVTRFYPIINYLLTIPTDRVICCSDFVRRSHIDNYRLPPSKLITIHNGIIPCKFDVEPSRAYLYEQFRIPPHAMVVCSVGALTRQKAHEHLISAVPMVVSHNPNVYFLIIGEGPRRVFLEDLVSKLNLSGRVVMPGVRTDVPQILKSATLFVLSSLWEGFPMVVLEAMACKLPIITTNVGGVGEAITHRETGFLVPAGDRDALAQTICSVLDDEELRRSIGLRSYELLNSRFTAGVMTGKTEQLYSELAQTL